jgi:hypothetical protein
MKKALGRFWFSTVLPWTVVIFLVGAGIAVGRWTAPKLPPRCTSAASSAAYSASSESYSKVTWEPKGCAIYQVTP